MACDTNLPAVECAIEEKLEALVNAELDGFEQSQTLRSPNGHMESVDNRGRTKLTLEALQYLRRINGGPAWKKTRTV